jgi:hypothetical protein
VYASWNGSTEVASWRVLGGKTAGGLTVPMQGFEIQVAVSRARYVAVQALAANGRVLGISKTVASGGREA